MTSPKHSLLGQGDFLKDLKDASRTAYGLVSGLPEGFMMWDSGLTIQIQLPSAEYGLHDF